MSAEFHVGDNVNMVGNHNIGKIEQGGATGRPAAEVRWAQPFVFVNYRKSDRQAATYLDEELTRRLGQGSVFRDVKMPVGTPFPPELTTKARTCAVLIAIIGEDWEGAEGRHSIDDPADWVRREIAIALRHGVTIVPVLVGLRDRPRTGDLPTEIREIAERQAPHLRHGYRTEDVRQLVDRLIREVPALREAASSGH